MGAASLYKVVKEDPCPIRWHLTRDLPALGKSGDRVLGRRSSSECKVPETDEGLLGSGMPRGQAGRGREETGRSRSPVGWAGYVRAWLSLLRDT